MLQPVNYIEVKPHIRTAVLHYYDQDEYRHQVELTPVLNDYEDLLGPFESTPAVLRALTRGLKLSHKISPSCPLEAEYYVIDNNLKEIYKYIEDNEKRN